MQLPKIKLNKAEMTNDDFKTELDKLNTGFSKILQPGNHDVKITKKEYLGAAASDPTWHKFRLTLVDAGGAETKELIMIPTVSIKYKSEKAAMLPAKRLTEFFAAIGENFTPTNFNELLNKYFIGEAVVGKRLNIDIGYRTNYVKYVSKDSFIIVDRNGHPYKDDKGEPLPVFNTKDEAGRYADSINLRVEKYSSVLKFNPSEVIDENDGDELPF